MDIFPDKIFSWHFPDSGQIPWHFPGKWSPACIKHQSQFRQLLDAAIHGSEVVVADVSLKSAECKPGSCKIIFR